MVVIRWLLLIPLALVLAIPTGAVVLLVAAVADPVLHAVLGHVVQAGFWAFADAFETLDEGGAGPDAIVTGAAKLAASLLVAPPVFVALVGEVWGTRAYLWYAGATGLLAAAVPWLARGAARLPTGAEAHVTLLLFLAGAAAGTVYWIVAGSSAGRRAAPVPPAHGRA